MPLTSSTAPLLNSYETCPRAGFFARSWASQRLGSSQMTLEAIQHVLACKELAGESSWGALAGATVMQLAADRGLDTTLHEIYPSVVHHSALADILVTTLRKMGDSPWGVRAPVDNWKSSASLWPDGSHLRRVILLRHWTEEREGSTRNCWGCLGECAVYGLPMKLAVLVIGQQRNGKRSSPFTKAFRHPSNRTLRFRKKERNRSQTFSDRWTQVLREDCADITTEQWLAAMLKDDVLADVAFHLEIPVPENLLRMRILDMSRRKLDALYAMKKKPEANLSGCDWPVSCAFKRCCWGAKETEPSEKNGYIQIDDYHL